MNPRLRVIGINLLYIRFTSRHYLHDKNTFMYLHNYIISHTVTQWTSFASDLHQASTGSFFPQHKTNFRLQKATGRHVVLMANLESTLLIEFHPSLTMRKHWEHLRGGIYEVTVTEKFGQKWNLHNFLFSSYPHEINQDMFVSLALPWNYEANGSLFLTS